MNRPENVSTKSGEDHDHLGRCAPSVFAAEFQVVIPQQNQWILSGSNHADMLAE